MLTDLDEASLWQYRSDFVAPTDLRAFWDRTLADAATHDLALSLERVEAGLESTEVFDVTFAGFGGHPVKGWLYVPRAVAAGPRPGVVQFVGYGGGRGHVLDHLVYSAAGYIHLVMDTRGQGASWSTGATGDPVGPTGPTIPGVMTRGIESPDDFYYRRLYTDAVRAVDAIKAVEGVDPHRIGVVGGSQGGGMALATAALRDDVAAAVAFVPFLCDIRRASVITDNDPYNEVARYLKVHRDATERVFETLSYIDGVGLAALNRTPTWVSAALMDPICPPSTVFGAFHALAGEKHMTVWQYNGHEGGVQEDVAMSLAAFADVFARG